MIKADTLTPCDTREYMFPFDVPFSALKEKFEQENETTFGLPIKISFDQLKSGSFLNSTTSDCLVIENTEHPNDYCKHCISMRKQGKINRIVLNHFGVSKLGVKMSIAEERKNTLSGMLMNAIAGPNQNAVQDERDYYGMIEQIFTTVCQ